MRTAETLDVSTTVWFSPSPRGMWAALSPFPRVRVNCRPLEGKLGLLADHCYIVSQRSDTDILYIESGPTNPVTPYGQNKAGTSPEMPGKDAAAVIMWKWFWRQATPAMRNCLTNAVLTWNQANIPYDPLAPNSNSFAGWITRECQSPARPSPFARAVGWLDLPLFQP